MLHGKILSRERPLLHQSSNRNGENAALGDGKKQANSYTL